MWVMWNLVSVRLEIVLVSVQDRCTVCTKRMIDSKNFGTHPMVLLVDKAHVEARFGLFGDSSNLDTRFVNVLHQDTTSSEIGLDAPDATPR
jgi:hypothetical protein